MSIKLEVGILGAGMMGSGIAYCFAQAGYDVVIKDIDLNVAAQAKDRVKASVERSISKGLLNKNEGNDICRRVVPTDAYGSLEGVDIIVEAVSEDVQLKMDVLQEIDKIAKMECIFTSNTSSISITLLASFLEKERRGRFVGTHFFSPAAVMKLVEVIPGLETRDETISVVLDICRRIGKTPVRVKDVTGFAVNRILHSMWIESNRLLEEGVATVEDIDTACKLGLGHPIGPFELMDLTSNDLNLDVQTILYKTYGERFRPRPILKQKVYAKHFGRKTGKGWYDY